MKRVIALSLMGLTASLAFAEIRYSVGVQTEPGRWLVTIEVPIRAAETQLQMPNWAPGTYSLRRDWNSVEAITATIDGQAATLGKANDYTWTAATPKGKTLKVTYKLPAAFNQERGHFSGPSTYLYVVGRKEEKTRLQLTLPEGWLSFCGLEQTKVPHEYVAPDYDVLADNPVSVGKLTYDTYTVRKVPHTIVYHAGNTEKVDRKKVLDTLIKISESQAKFFGGLPFKKYIWHIIVNDAPDGGWGLEHLSSTQIGMAVGFGPGIQAVMSHEYFHAWNVKRIRSKVLGPFDYTKLPITGALWWLEGVTDYYAYVIPSRDGVFDKDFWMRTLLSNHQQVRRNPARLRVSAYDSSAKVGEAANGQGNSDGFEISYYDLGHILGMCLDIELRHQTKGKRSLDDVMKSLFKMTHNKPGFEEDEIRKQLIRVGGAAMGPIYDQWVMKPGDYPVEDQLKKVGMEIAQMEESFTKLPVDVMVSRDGMKVEKVPEGSELQVGDVLKAVQGDNVPVSQRGQQTFLRRNIERLKIGDEVTVQFLRGTETKEVKIRLVEGKRPVQKIQPRTGASADEIKLREGWLGR